MHFGAGLPVSAPFILLYREGDYTKGGLGLDILCFLHLSLFNVVYVKGIGVQISDLIARIIIFITMIDTDDFSPHLMINYVYHLEDEVPDYDKITLIL